MSTQQKANSSTCVWEPAQLEVTERECVWDEIWMSQPLAFVKREIKPQAVLQNSLEQQVMGGDAV